MNIVLVNSEYFTASGGGCGGIARYTYTMADAFASRGHSVHILVRDGTIPEITEKKIQVHHINHIKPRHLSRSFDRIFNGTIYWEMGFSEAVRKKVEEINSIEPVDIVDIPDYGGLAFAFKKKRTYKLVITFHTPSVIVDKINNDSISNKKIFEFESKAIANADFYKSPSRALATDVSSLYKLDIKNIPIVPYPVDTSLSRNVDRDYSKNSDVLFVGRLEKRKGMDLIVSRIKDILSIDDNINITFAGEYELDNATNYRLSIENLLDSKARKRVWFPGALNRYTLFSLYKRSNIFIFPSIFDNFPNALLEAMSVGLPIVASNCGGASEIAKDGDNALLFDYKNGDKFIESIALLHSSEELRRRLGESAKIKIETIYSFDNIVRNYLESFNNS